jgi:hypothetical protein
MELMQSMHVIRSKCYHSFVFFISLVFSALIQAAPPTFNMAFSPTTIGPGSTSTLTYTINNAAEATGVSGLSFNNTFPTGMTIVNPSSASTTCVDGVLTATAGASSITISDYRLSAAESCTVTFNVTSSTVGTHVNTSGALTTSAGSAGTANTSLVVDAERPGFSMAFSPSTINQGAVSTLTYTLDNSANGSTVLFMLFTNALPSGLVIADQPEGSTTCTNGELTAVGGGSTITTADASIANGASCTYSVNVTAAEAGEYINVSGALSRNGSNPSGVSTALLTVVNPFLNANFPASVAPGTSVTLSYSLNNLDRDNTATDITFTNDLNATLSGLTATVLPASDFCGSGSTISGTSNITIAGANLAASASCSFDLTVLIPSNAATGTYTNTTSTVNLTLGSATTKPALSHALVVSKSPVITMSFIDDPVVTGQNVTLRFTVTNTDTTNAASDLTFIQSYDDVYTGMVLSTLPNANSCGTGSTFRSQTDGSKNWFEFAGGALAAGANCTFDLIYTLPTSGTSGSYLHASSAITGTLSGSAVTGNIASDTLVVLAAPRLSISLDDYAVPGTTVMAELRLAYSESAAADIADLAFTIDLDSALNGMTMTSATASDICGTGSSISGTSTISFSGGSLAANGQCSFSVTFQIPSGATPALYILTSSTVTGTTAATSVASAAVSKALTVSGLTLSKTFLTNNLLPGDTVSARYIISNSASALAATDILFTVNLNQSLSSLAPISLPSTPCGAGSTITGTTTLTLSAGNLQPGTACTFDVPLLIPSGTSAGIYNIPTSTMSATVGGNNTENPNAVDVLYVETLEAAISANVSNPTYTSPITVTINFDRSVVNFVEGDLTITNGSVSNFSGSGQSYSLDVIPTTAGDVVISLPANTVDDAVNGSVQNTTESLTVVFAAAPENVVVTVPANAVNNVGNSYIVSGTHTINGSKVFLYADSDNDGIADNTTLLASDTVVNGAWSMTAILTFQITNNFVVAWDDRENRVSGAVNVPTITEVTPNFDPVISGSPATSVAEDSSYSFTPTMTDANTNDTHLFSITNQPTWADFSTSTGALTGIPINADVGTSSNVVITVTDSSSLSASLAGFNLTVSNTNDALVISGTPSTSAVQGTSYSFTPTVSDEDLGDSTTFSITNQPSWTSFNTATGALTGTPSNSDVGIHSNIVIGATDSGGAISNLAAYSITVSNTNDAPVISGAPSTMVAEDAAYSFTPSVNDVDSGDTQTFSISNQPSWANFSTSTGELNGTPTNDDLGVFSSIVITITDSASATDSLPGFSVTVSNTNDAPVISGAPGATVAEDAIYSFIPVVNDVDSGDTLSFSITNPPSWSSFNASTGALTGTPTNGDVGLTSGIVITASDAVGATASLASFSITVSNTNDAPVIGGAPSTSVAEDTNYNFTPTVSDEDLGDSTTFSITNQPSWTSFNTATGALTGTPSNSDVGIHSNIVIGATDSGGAISNLAAYSITVSNTNDAPVISGAPSTMVAEDAAYSFTPSVNDVDSGDTQTFSISNQPSWANFSTSTGELNGTPTNDDLGVFSSIVITITDSASATDSLPGFSVTVSNTNDAPVISGTPKTTVVEGVNYSFIPTVNDVDLGDTLTASITNKPSWAAFDSATGVLSGIPGNANITSYNNIVISVSDGALSTNLVAFSITVFADLDRDGISDVTDLDIDGDGMSNAFEIANGLDPFDASDASGDLDGDGKTNLEEFTNNSDPSRDDYGPVIILESIVTIDAVALLTDLPANLASAEDENDGDVLVTHDLSTELLEPGVHTIIWLAVDAAGNSTSETQTLNVRPLANWQVDQETGEGNTVTVTLYLNGEAPIYPVVANYTVSGSATNPADHNAVSGSLIINSGQSASVDVVVTSDITSELDETVIFTLDSISNATFGVQKDHQITISEVNHAPRVSLSTPFTLLALTSGTVTVTATIDDADLSDSHTNTWMANNGLSGNANNTSYSFDPAVVGAGTYQISVTSEDDAVSSLSGTAVITLTVLDQVLSLSDSIDSDGDGVNDSAEGAGDSDGDNVPDFADSAAEENVLAIFPVGGEPNDGAWFMEAQPGISLHLNVYSSASGDFSPLLEEGDIIDANEINNSDTGHEYIGGIFDFVLSNIPVQGETVFVVLPQLNAIPANAIYRKEVNGRWSAFEEDANNILSSALGEQGICPPPGSMEYVPGLTEGHFCVQLGLEDGGANDADGEANGSIIDPGGVAVAVPTRVSTGGGAMAWPALLLMSLMVLGRIAGVSVLMLGLSSIAHASEWLKSAYTTVHVGHADSNVSTEEVQGEFNGAGISNTTINDVDDPRKGFGLGVGYSFIPNWGIELAYLDLRQVDVDLTSTQAINNLDDVMPESGDGFTLSVLHRYPLDEIANVRFRLGVFDWQADYDTPTGAGSQVGSIEQSGTDWYAGIGFDHKITDQLNITTEFQYFDFNRDNTTYFRLGLEWHLDYGK